MNQRETYFTAFSSIALKPDAMSPKSNEGKAAIGSTGTLLIEIQTAHP
ncbi:MAG: hypothetical protein ACLFR7_08760 [Opitutales bacterium]